MFAAVDGRLGGVLLTDPLRPDAPRMMRALRNQRTVLVTGDRAGIAESVVSIVGTDAVYADRDPAEKVAIVRDEQAAAPHARTAPPCALEPGPRSAAAGAARLRPGGSARIRRFSRRHAATQETLDGYATEWGRHGQA